MTNDLSIPNPQLQVANAKSVGGQIAALDRMIADMAKGALHKPIGDRLRLAMVEAGYKSIASLARALDQDDSRVRNWVNGHSRPPIEEGLRLKRLLRVDLDWIYDGDPTGLSQAMYVKLGDSSQKEPSPPKKRPPKIKPRAAACVVPIERRRRQAE